MSIAEENRATWRLVRTFIDEYPNNEFWAPWRETVLPLLNRATDCEFDTLFRAGMSMSHLIFSTIDHHGLRDEPRITVEVTSEWKLRISYSTWNLQFKQPTQFAVAEPHQAFPVFTPIFATPLGRDRP
jgi:hypothetical protein